MMKKKLLFVIPSLRSGGAEKSLVTLLQVLDYTQYDVDLFLFRRDGLFLPLIPPQVRILDAGDAYRIFDGDTRTAIVYFLKRGKPLTALHRYRYAKALTVPHERWLERAWRHLSPMLPRLKGYDAAIAYLEGTSTYFVADRVQAKKKIAFLHTNYDSILQQKRMDTQYYAKFDTLVSISQACCEKAVSHFPFLQGRTLCLANIVSPALVRKMAQQDAALPRKGSDATLLTVGRLVDLKRIDRAVQACALLVQRGWDVCWYVIGAGPLEEELRALAFTRGVADCFLFLGEQSNPYPALRACDIYVQTSQVEGKSIAIDEAKCMAKPIVVTNFETVYDQIQDKENGLIAAMDPSDIADAVETLLREPALREQLTKNLLHEKVGTEDEVQKFYAIL